MDNFTKQYNFDSQIELRGKFKSDFSQAIIKAEPMFFNSDLAFAYENGGEVTKAFIDALPADWKGVPVVLDSRVHMLMKGWYPCIPGFHHDDIPRTNDHLGQPNYDDPDYKSEHLMGLVNGDIAPTRFALNLPGLNEPFNEVPADRVVYSVWHHDVTARLEAGTMKVEEAPSGEYIQFNWNSWHEGQRARGNGWRWFVRLSRNTARTKTITNEFRRQVQVYLENPMQGW